MIMIGILLLSQTFRKIHFIEYINILNIVFLHNVLIIYSDQGFCRLILTVKLQHKIQKV